MHTTFRRAALAAVLPLAFAGCASTAVDAQWRNVELPATYLRGARVMVSCETGEAVLQRICEDRVSAELAARDGLLIDVEPAQLPAQLVNRYRAVKRAGLL